MEIHNLLDVKSRAELREWLIQNHKTEKECWVVVKRGRPTDDNTFWYIDAVEEALCFGWIDSTTKKIANDVTAQKLCPRKPRSNWSELNKERCRRMERLGLMTDAGRAVLPDMSPSGFTIDKDILQRLQSDPVVWNNFCHFPDLYRRIRIDTIQIKKNVSIRPTTGIKPLYTTIATVTMNLIVSAAIVLLNPYVTIYISYKIPPFALSVHIPDVSTSIYVEVDSKVLLGLPFCDKAFVR